VTSISLEESISKRPYLHLEPTIAKSDDLLGHLWASFVSDCKPRQNDFRSGTRLTSGVIAG
jgi:hypothetical protein